MQFSLKIESYLLRTEIPHKIPHIYTYFVFYSVILLKFMLKYVPRLYVKVANISSNRCETHCIFTKEMS